MIGDVAIASRQSVSSGTHTPTSDYMDDSYVSAEENNSTTANSSQAEPGTISIYSTSTESSTAAVTATAVAVAVAAAAPPPLTTTTTTTTAAVAAAAAAPSSGSSYLHFNNNSAGSKNRNALSVNQPPPATSIIHLSPGGSTVIEYKSASNLQQQLNSVSMQSNSSFDDRDHHHSGSSNGAAESGSEARSTSANASTPHQHYHKKYIKQMNALNGSPITVSAVSAIASSSLSPNAITVSSPSTTTYTIPLHQDYGNSIKFADHETVIVENEYTHISSHHHNVYDVDRSDDYVTPMSSPRHQQLPSTPQKPLTTNAVLSPGGTSMTSSVHSSPTALPPVSPLSQNKQKHPNNLPYDPFIHTNNKPPLSFSSLIFLAIEDAQEKALPVKEIYAWIVQHYPYFKTAPTGWKNSVRHNLSLNKCFQKVEKAPVSVRL